MVGTRTARKSPPPIFWIEERVEILRQGFEAGDSFGQIAKAIGGCSRNACIGKASRLGWARVLPSKPARLPREPRAPRVARNTYANAGLAFGTRTFVEVGGRRPPRANVRLKAFAPLIGSAPRPWTERLSGMCCWPVDDDGPEALSCCLPVADRGWCAQHLIVGLAPAGITQRENKRVAKDALRAAA